jgi:hypothetical protein
MIIDEQRVYVHRPQLAQVRLALAPQPPHADPLAAQVIPGDHR